MGKVIDTEEYVLSDDVKLKVEREEMQVGSDKISVHIYQESGNERHRVSNFRVDDAEEKTAYYVQTRNRSEPWQMALIGLQEYGFDCTNFPLEKTEDEQEEIRTETLRKVTQQVGMLTEGESDEVVVDALSRAEAYLKFAVMAREFNQEHGHSMSELDELDVSDLSIQADDDNLELTVAVIQTMLKRHTDVEFSLGTN